MHITPIKIGFVLLSNAKIPIPSTRIAVLNMFPFLRAAEFDPHIVFEPEGNDETPNLSGLSTRLKAEGFQIVYFQKVHGDSVLTLARELRALSIKTIFGICDYVEPNMVDATDVTVTVTDYLKSLYPAALQPKISIVHDGIENPSVYKTDWGLHSGSRARPLRAVLVTSLALDKLPILVNPPSWLHVTIVGRYAAQNQRIQRIREARWQLLNQDGWREKLNFLEFVMSNRIKRVAWEANCIYDNLQQADIGIIPIEPEPTETDFKRLQMKSENRLTLKMAIGLPVVATPIPAYEKLVQQGQNGFLAHNLLDWLRYLTMLRDPDLRRSIGQQARQSALTAYSMDLQAKKLISVLRALLDPL